jgi:cyclopropane-fatty-acyl-phospholipid synthase
MLEHVRNHGELLSRIARWLEPDGRFFAHVFSHRELAWTFNHENSNDWMARWFFTGGIMPSADFLPRVTTELREVDRWHFSGEHYEKTLRAWLSQLDDNRAEVLNVFMDAYGKSAKQWLHRWRVFLLVSAELWGFRKGSEFGVTHHLFVPVSYSQQ